MTALGVVRTSSSAVAIEPFMPWAAGVRTISAPRNASILRRSIDIDFRPSPASAGSREEAATKANAMPVLPDVGSISTVSAVDRARLFHRDDHGGGQCGPSRSQPD